MPGKGGNQEFLELFKAGHNLRPRRWGMQQGTSAYERLPASHRQQAVPAGLSSGADSLLNRPSDNRYTPLAVQRVLSWREPIDLLPWNPGI